ncbi:hypothetical protein [Chelatococcus composti]|jgi:hypothetical protein|uniref:Uncharacterized protein n=1 Tax=Chelatococcus composti TaxID=1743235 RepID=A0A841KER2_9HYPH|nr:hypothetical protein [Chelatococcus composti]MBB6168426.1 hypothetical protein [Chelatococcus composti]MBS7736494.1 hypothetical protein [Chelatococcus composti]GGG39991.1 hypothetical protein GCM10008026_21120 [Chelatococcus composti]
MDTRALLEWFRQQNEGLRTYSSLRELCAKDMAPGAPDAALRQLLVCALDGFIDRYFGEPFTSEVARTARENTLKLLEEAAAASEADAAGKVAALDKLAFRQIVD